MLRLVRRRLRRGGVASITSPADLAMLGWWRASYTASPWVGTASTGTSNTRNLVEATNPPATGTAVNSLTPARFDGTNDVLNSSEAMTTYGPTTGYSGFSLVYVNAITTNDGTNIHVNDAVVSDTAARFGIMLRSNNTVTFFHFNGSVRVQCPVAFTTAAWQLIQWKYDGTNLMARVNAGAWASAAAAAPAFTGATIRVGNNFNTEFMDGDMLELGLINTVVPDLHFDNILAYARTRYALALT